MGSKEIEEGRGKKNRGEGKIHHQFRLLAYWILQDNITMIDYSHRWAEGGGREHMRKDDRWRKGEEEKLIKYEKPTKREQWH